MLPSAGGLNRNLVDKSTQKGLEQAEKQLLADVSRRTIDIQVGATGFEPATSWSQTKRSSQAELRPVDVIHSTK